MAGLRSLGAGLFYALAALDPAIPDGIFLKKVTSPIRTFVVLMAASLAAVRVYFVQPTTLWKEASYRSAITDQVAQPADSPSQKVPTETEV